MFYNERKILIRKEVEGSGERKTTDGWKMTQMFGNTDRYQKQGRK